MINVRIQPINNPIKIKPMELNNCINKVPFIKPFMSVDITSNKLGKSNGLTNFSEADNCQIINIVNIPIHL